MAGTDTQQTESGRKLRSGMGPNMGARVSLACGLGSRCPRFRGQHRRPRVSTSWAVHALVVLLVMLVPQHAAPQTDPPPPPSQPSPPPFPAPPFDPPVPPTPPPSPPPPPNPPHPPAPPTPGNWNIEVPKRDSNGDFCVMNFSSNAVGDARSRYGALAPNQVRGFPVYHVPPYAINAPL